MRLFTTIGLLALLLCLVSISALAQETTSSFPDGVIEVPQGTPIDINDDAGTVTITNAPVEIHEGDTFVVYLQDLPIGYVAKSISIDGSNTVVSIEKADESIYTMLNESGVIELTPDICEFVSTEGFTTVHNTAAKSGGISMGDTLSYNDGTLKIQKSYGGNTFSVSLSNMTLTHSVSNGDLSLALHGNWNISTPVLSTSEDVLEDLPLVSIRIAGVGKITLKLSMTMSLNMTCDFSGTFSVGFDTSSGEAGKANSSFTVKDQTVSGKGKIEGSLKITGCVDILFAAADLYGEIGIGTEEHIARQMHRLKKKLIVQTIAFMYCLELVLRQSSKYQIQGLKSNSKEAILVFPKILMQHISPTFTSKMASGFPVVARDGIFL